MKNLLFTVCRKTMIVGAAVVMLVAAAADVAFGQKVSDARKSKGKSTQKYSDAPFSLDSLVGTLKFQFEPAVVKEQDGSKYVSTAFFENMESPIWMLANMGAPMLFDTTTFKISDLQASTDGWTIKSAVPDSIYGSIAVDLNIKKSGETHLRISTASGVLQNYAGRLFPYERSYVFANAGAAKRAAKNQKMIDEIVPTMTFRVESFPMMGYHNTSKDERSELINHQYLNWNKISVTTLQKINAKWYIRMAWRRDTELDKQQIEDYCINTFTGMVLMRFGNYNAINVYWYIFNELPHYIAPA